VTSYVLHQALACTERGWPVFLCHSGSKARLTRCGYPEAATGAAQVTEWFARYPDRNLAVATGAPGPGVPDIDYHGPAASGYRVLTRPRPAGLLQGAAAP
jgi:Bifunctional DNA primase/polymerase, N-terminal